jgi:hypothetical protein
MKNINMQQLKEDIASAITQAREEYLTHRVVYQDEKPNKRKNEFLFFIKPEITLPGMGIKLEKILGFILDKIDAYNLEIRNVKVLAAKYLQDYNIIAQHYGVINQISRNAKANISQEGNVKFESLYECSPDKANVMGSIEFIEKYDAFSPMALDYLWQNGDMKKLAGGTYVTKLSLDGEEVYLVNGFHPRQLEHFTATGRSIVTFTLAGDLDWKTARGTFIGATNPANAKEGSIRRELMEKKKEFGLQTINSSWNGVHLSAGPVEGLVELIRYNSDFEANEILKPADFDFGKNMAHHFNPEEIEKIINNTILEMDGKKIPVFDLTEEQNADEAVNLLRKVI